MAVAVVSDVVYHPVRWQEGWLQGIARSPDALDCSRAEALAASIFMLPVSAFSLISWTHTSSALLYRTTIV